MIMHHCILLLLLLAKESPFPSNDNIHYIIVMHTMNIYYNEYIYYNTLLPSRKDSLLPSHQPSPPPCGRLPLLPTLHMI